MCDSQRRPVSATPDVPDGHWAASRDHVARRTAPLLCGPRGSWSPRMGLARQPRTGDVSWTYWHGSTSCSFVALGSRRKLLARTSVNPARGPSNPATSARRVTLGSYSVDVISIPAPPRWLAHCALRVADDFLARWLALTGTGRTTRNWNLVVVVGPVDSYGNPDPAGVRGSCAGPARLSIVIARQRGTRENAGSDGPTSKRPTTEVP
jgi:hypothetical protein